MKYVYVITFALVLVGCSVSGDKRIDTMLDQMKVEVVNDIPANTPDMAGNHIGDKIRMKPRSSYSQKQQYLLVLLHEIAHHIGGMRKRISYTQYKQNEYRLLEELIANKYAMQMMKILGYKLKFSYDDLNNEYMNTLKNRYGYTEAQINRYVNSEVKESIKISKKLLQH